MSRFPARTVIRLVALASLTGGCAPDGDGPAQVSQPIAGGVSDTTHTDVVGIAILRPNGLATCTGSLIAPNLVLTARHCVSPVDESGVVCSDATIGGVARAATLTAPNFAASTFHVTTDAAINPRNSRFTAVAEVLTPADATGVPLCGHDIALLRLATPISTTSLIVPRLDIDPREHEVFTASGYGGTNNDGLGAGVRRMRGGLTVEHVGLAATRGVVIVAESELVGNAGTCRGDSGGPALDELGAVFGVLSRGGADCSTPIYTRVDAFAGWIREVAARAATLGGYAPPAWVTPPEERPGAQGDACSADVHCALPLACLPTGRARECTTTDCKTCPDGWVCEVSGPRCERDPRVAPPPPVDAGPPPAADAGAPPVDAGAPSATSAATSSGCAVSRAGSDHGGSGVWVLAAMALARGGVRRARRRSR